MTSTFDASKQREWYARPCVLSTCSPSFRDESKENTMRRFSTITAVATPLLIIASPVQAEPVKFEALVAQKEAIRLDFADASKHFFLLVRREGKSEGQGPLAGATVQEYGAHDVVPGVGGEPRGYLEFTTTDGNKAYIKWVIQAVFVPGPDGKPKLLDNGVWQVVGGTGKLEKLKGAGSFRLLPTGPTERRFVMEGELVQ
ncbi:hypothetical protein [Mesorhizobium sp.]|uniref:hypothetical protein n=1 Tax=Mesorhizobium sp. TaxID=1871066 RepID=UPI00257DDB5A|nr:hypothetical protein [Mesorhizobium sp.]